MAWFTYNQNNSGGAFRGPEFIIIEAETADEANERALDQGIYFDGVSEGIDCECCGSRWYRALPPEGKANPHIYGKPPEEHKPWFKTCDIRIVPLEGDVINRRLTED